MDSNPVVNDFDIKDPSRDIEVAVRIETRWLGEDTGKTILLNLSDHILQLANQMTLKTRKLTDIERETLGQLVSNF